VEILNAKGTVVARVSGFTGKSWTPKTNLAVGTGYQFRVSGVDAAGLQAAWGLSDPFSIR